MAGPPTTCAPATCPPGPIQYPPIGALVSKELGSTTPPLPNFVSIAPYRFFNPAAYGPGFLGPQYAPLIVGDGGQFVGQQGNQNYANALKVENIDLPADVDKRHADARLELLQDMQKEFVADHPGVAPAQPSDRVRPRRPADETAAAKAFNLDEESDASCATPMAATCSARAVCWHGGWSSKGCRSSR